MVDKEFLCCKKMVGDNPVRNFTATYRLNVWELKHDQ